MEFFQITSSGSVKKIVSVPILMNKDVFSRNILLIDSIREISRVCMSRNIEMLLLKGAALLELGIFKFFEREMTDVDVLMKPGKVKEFEHILRFMGFELMKNSSSAFIKGHGKNTPPVIIDVHADLRHVENHNDLWKNAYILNKEFPNIFLPCAEDLFLHVLAHPILHHGFLTDKAKSDAIKVLVWIDPVKSRFAGPSRCSSGDNFTRVNKTGGIDNFWNNLAKKSKECGLNPIIYHVLETLGKSNPDLVPSDKINLFYPKNSEKIKAYFFKKAVDKHSGFLEYFLPVLYKPSLAVKYMFPEREFLRRRYGRDGLLVYVARPFKVLSNAFCRNRPSGLL